LIGERLITPFEMTTSKAPSSKGRASMLASANSTWVNPSRSLRRVAFAICSSVKSTPITRPESPTWTAAQNTSVPEPEPRSSTLSPGASAARSRWYPTPANDASASAGIASSSSLGYLTRKASSRPTSKWSPASSSRATWRYISLTWVSSSSRSTSELASAWGNSAACGVRREELCRPQDEQSGEDAACPGEDQHVAETLLQPERTPPRRVDDLHPDDQAGEDEREVLEVVDGLVRQRVVVDGGDVPGGDHEHPDRKADRRKEQKGEPPAEPVQPCEGSKHGTGEEEEEERAAQRDDGKRGR